MAMVLKRTINYQNRLFIAILVFTWIITFTFCIVQYSREKEYKVEVIKTRLQEINNRIISDLENGKTIDDNYVNQLSKVDSVRVSLIALNGDVIYDSNKNAVMQNHSDRQEVIDAIKTGKGYTIRRQSAANDQDYFYSATLAKNLVVRTSLLYNSTLKNSLSINLIYTYIIIITTIVISLFGYFASRRISKNVQALRDFAVLAERGNIENFDIAEFPKNELGEISGHIVNLYRNLQKTAKERDVHLQEAIFEESEKTRIKQQLTNNINHELKTPVHAIQACLETIINHGSQLSEDAKKELIEKSYTNSQRLANLLHDISIITRMTEAANKIEVRELQLSKLIYATANEFLSLYPADKFMNLHIDIPKDLEIIGNSSLLESVFKNLFENAVNYSEGTDMYLKCVCESDDIINFSFYDNGKGVAPEHLIKIFERFYRVDDGRSRVSGGTGLGLSIVRNAILFHKGSITALNRNNGGLQFDFTITKQ